VKKILAVILFTLLTACATTTEVVHKPPRYPDYNLLLVLPPKINPEVYAGMDPDKKKVFEQITGSMCNVFMEGVTEYFNKKPVFKKVVTKDGGVEDKSKTLILESTFTKIKAGHQGARFIMTYIVGIPGFGKPCIEMAYKLIDGATGKLIDEAEEKRDSSFRMGKFEGDISIMYTKELADEAGGFLENYMQTDLNDT
jgi:hypothetical protein